MRLNRFLAQRGVASRRVAEDFILQGRVAVNGRIVRELATRVDPARDRVCVDGREVRSAGALILMLNKPSGYDVTRSDPHSERNVYSLIPAAFRETARAVGRLDRATTGLLLFTNEGVLAHRLTHPSFGVEKEYLAFGAMNPSREQMDRLLDGVSLEDGLAKAVRAEAIPGVRGLRIVVKLGRKRVVRRMCEAVGYPLNGLHRTRVGPLELGDLTEGRWRELRDLEARMLREAAGLSAEGLPQ
jgi:23S rRNA pseudouridine2605 synthase